MSGATTVVDDIKTTGSEFGYDAQQNRYKKDNYTRETTKSTVTEKHDVSYYIRDAQGNVLSIYNKKHHLISSSDAIGNSQESYQLTQKEQHLYGSSRLGIVQLDRQMSMMSWSGADLITQNQGIRNYELTNHLGNVLSTITDKGMITSAQDYYPFGLTLASRSFTEGGSVYRFGFNGQEKTPELGGGHTTAEYWEYDARLGRRWNRDPIVLAWQSPYATLDNNPIALSDPSGASTEQGDPVKETEPTYDPAKDVTTKVLSEVTVTAKRMPLMERVKASIDRMKEKVQEGYEKLNKTIAPQAIAVISALDAFTSDMLMKPEPFYKPGDWGYGDYKRIARDGQIFGHGMAVIVGLSEVPTGAGMTGTGGVLTVSVIGAEVGIPLAGAGMAISTHGTAVFAMATSNLIKMQMEETDNQAHDNHETNGSNEVETSEPIYENPGHHDPSNNPGNQNQYNGEKSVLPKNHQELWKKSVPDPKGDIRTRWTVEGSSKRKVIHRFQHNNHGVFHWNGSTNGMTKSGKKVPLKAKIPKL